METSDFICVMSMTLFFAQIRQLLTQRLTSWIMFMTTSSSPWSMTTPSSPWSPWSILIKKQIFSNYVAIKSLVSRTQSWTTFIATLKGTIKMVAWLVRYIGPTIPQVTRQIFMNLCQISKQSFCAMGIPFDSSSTT